MVLFENLTKRFQRNAVLKGVTLRIERGHRVALVGSNGAGKTTLIRCLLGEYVCGGLARVDDQDPREHRREVLSKVGFVPQLPPPLKMPVGQLIRFAATLAIHDWGFSSPDRGLTWKGYVSGPDRLRFLGVLSRYAALLVSIRLDEVDHKTVLNEVANG